MHNKGWVQVALAGWRDFVLFGAVIAGCAMWWRYVISELPIDLLRSHSRSHVMAGGVRRNPNGTPATLPVLPVSAYALTWLQICPRLLPVDESTYVEWSVLFWRRVASSRQYTISAMWSCLFHEVLKRASQSPPLCTSIILNSTATQEGGGYAQEIVR